MAKWYIQRNDKQAGPFESAQLKQLGADGKIKPDDLLRRDDQEAWHKASSVKGLLIAPKREEPKPEQVQPSAAIVPPAHISKAKTKTESKASVQKTLQSGANSFWNATKRTAEIAAKQTEIAKITQFSLPAAYQSFGEAYYNRHANDKSSDSLISEISEIKAEVVRHRESLRCLPSSTVMEKAKFAAATAANMAKEKVVDQRIKSCFQTLGESLFAKGNNEPDFLLYQEKIQLLLKAKAELLARIEELKAKSTPPQTIPSPIPSTNHLIAKETRLRWSIPIGICLCALMLTTLAFFAKASLTRLIAGKTGENSKQEKVERLPDFKQIDYAYDFSNTDYEAIPENAKREVRERNKGDSFIVSKGYTTKILDLSETSSIENAPLFLTPHGKQEIYADSTKKRLVSDSMYFHEKPHGLSHFYDEKGDIIGVVPWVDGEKHGIELWTYSNKKPKIKNHFLKGKAHGTHEEWYEDGQKKKQATFVDGLQVGACTEWFSDGTVAIESNYIDGKRCGEFVRYGQFGRNKERLIVAKGLCDQDKLIGQWSIRVECRHKGFAEFQEIKVATGPWTGGSRKELLAKLALLDYFHPNVDAIEGYLGVHLFNKTGPLPGVYGAVFRSANDFAAELGQPDFEMPDPEYRSDNLRLFRYDCTDGPLIFKATLQYPNGLANGVRIVLVSDTTINKP